MAKLAGMKLRCRDGHFGWAGWELVTNHGNGYGMLVPCQLGDHWLYDAPDGSIQHRTTPFLWPTAAEALAARDRWERQEDTRETAETISGEGNEGEEST